MKFTKLGRAAVVAAAGAVLLSSCAANEDSGNTDPSTSASESTLSGELAASGASSQEAAQKAWVAAFQTANPDVTVNYQVTGSGVGRDNFIAGASNFVGSDRAFNDDEIATGGFGACTTDDIVEIPVYISPVAVAFNIDGIDTLNLDAATIAGIFAGTITNWDDDAIASQNDGVDLPDLAISPVHRSDKSGTTQTFTQYLNSAAGDVWTDEAAEVWPITGGESAEGTSGVVQAIKTGNGAIGYADASQVKDLGEVHVKVGDEYVPYSAEAAAALVEASPLVEGRGDADIVFDVDPSAAADGAYPIALVSYLIGCESYEDANIGALVSAYFTYVASEDGQKAAADAAGSAPISDSVREQINTAIALIKTS